MRQHGAMDSTLVSEAKNSSSNSGGTLDREEVTIRDKEE